MIQLSPQALANELKMAAQITEKLLLHPFTDLRDEMNRLGAYLQASETKLMSLMNGDKPGESEPGATQYGLALYIFDTTHPDLRKLLGFPQTQMTLETLEQWDTEVHAAGVVDYDGSLIATSKFGNLDANWVTALIYYIALKLGVSEVSSMAPLVPHPRSSRLTEPLRLRSPSSEIGALDHGTMALSSIRHWK